MAIYSDYLVDGKFSYLKAMTIHWIATLMIISFIIGLITAPSSVGIVSILINAYLAYLIFVKWPKKAEIDELLTKARLEKNKFLI